MAGFENDIGFAKNFDFTQSDNQAPAEANGLATNGQLWVGTTVVNAGGTHINVGAITSPLGTLSIGYSTPNITIDMSGGSVGIDSVDVQANTAPGTDPVVPTAAGLITVNGAAVANHSVVLETRSRAANAYNLEVQYAAAAAATDATKSGVAHFNSALFTVDANGFVSTSGAALVQSITGGPGITITGTAAVPIVNSVIFTDQPASIAITSDSGSFATNGAGIILDLPAAPAQGELIEVVCTTANAVAIDCPAGDFIRAGVLITSSGGTLTSTAIGDSVVMRFNFANQTWYATSLIGTWLVA